MYIKCLVLHNFLQNIYKCIQKSNKCLNINQVIHMPLQLSLVFSVLPLRRKEAVVFRGK